MSVKHLQKYIDEFSNPNNVHLMDTMDQINSTSYGIMKTKKLTYREMVG
ncbi:MAG: hypothetical protein OXC97_01665 [Candidatus Dadabacteria bacterium]|nr:hypothetical protein [Candidatus Dadabacteria bacterium]